MYRYVIDSQDAKRNREGYIGCGGSISYTAVIGTPIFSDEDDTEPVTLETAKVWCAIDGNDFDDIVTDLITAAREQCEAYTNLSFIPRTVTAKVRANTPLPYGPVEEIVSITGEDGQDITDEYKDLTDGVYVVTYTTLPPEKYPAKYRTAILNQVAYLFEHRGDEQDGQMSPGAKAILKPLRRI